LAGSNSPINQSEKKRASDYKEGFEFLIQNKNSVDSYQIDFQHLIPHELNNEKWKHLFSPNSGSKIRSKKIKIMRFMTDKRQSKSNMDSIYQSNMNQMNNIQKINMDQPQISKFQVKEETENEEPNQILVDSAKENYGRVKKNLLKHNLSNSRKKKLKLDTRKSAKILTRNLNHLRKITQINPDSYSQNIKKRKELKNRFIYNLNNHSKSKIHSKHSINQNENNYIPISPHMNTDQSYDNLFENPIQSKHKITKKKKLSLKSPKIIRNLVLENFLKTPKSLLDHNSSQKHINISLNKKRSHFSNLNLGKIQKLKQNLKEIDSNKLNSFQYDLKMDQYSHYDNSHFTIKNLNSKNSINIDGKNQKSKKCKMEINIHPQNIPLPPLPITPSGIMKRNKKHRTGPKTILNVNIKQSLKTKISKFDCNINLKQSSTKKVFLDPIPSNIECKKKSIPTKCKKTSKNLPKIFAKSNKDSFNNKFKKKSTSEKIISKKFPHIRSRKSIRTRDLKSNKANYKFINKMNPSKSNFNLINKNNFSKVIKKNKRMRNQIENPNNQLKKDFIKQKNFKMISKIKDSEEMQLMMNAWKIHTSKKSPKIKSLYRKMFKAVLTENNEDEKIKDQYPKYIKTETGFEDVVKREKKNYDFCQISEQMSKPSYCISSKVDYKNYQINEYTPNSIMPLESFIFLQKYLIINQTENSAMDYYFHKELKDVLFGKTINNLKNSTLLKPSSIDKKLLFNLQIINNFVFPAITVKVNQDSSLNLYKLDKSSKYISLTSMLRFFDGNLDLNQIKVIFLKIIKIFISLDNNQIGINLMNNDNAKCVRRNSLDNDSSVMNNSTHNLEKDEEFYKCKTDRNDLNTNNEIYLNNLVSSDIDQTDRGIKSITERHIERNENSSFYCKYNLIDHIILNGNNIKILFDHQIRNLFKKYNKSKNNALEKGLRSVLGLFFFNFIFNKRKHISDINQIVKILEYILIRKMKVSKRKSKRHSKCSKNEEISLLNFDKECLLEYELIAHKLSIGLINIIKKLLNNEEIINLHNLKEFFERQEIGVKNMGKFSLNIQNLVDSFYFGKCWELCHQNKISNFKEFKQNLISII
jgi:hypothetical protein